MPSKRYDAETFLDDVIGLVRDNLSAKVVAINAEKADKFQIKDIPAKQYHPDIMDGVINQFPFVYYGVIEIEVGESVGSHTQLDVTVIVAVVFDNKGHKGNNNQALRYTRILREIIQEDFLKFPSAGKMQVVEFAPADFSSNQGADFKIGGIHVKASIAG